MIARVAAILPPLIVLGFAATTVAGCSRPHAAMRRVTVAIIDTGVDSKTPLAGMLDVGASSSVLPSDRRGHDASGARDQDGHGTEMAAVVHGAAPSARLVSVQAIGVEGTSDALLASAISRAQSAGASVILLAMSGAEPLPQTRAAIADAGRHDVLVVAAAGNDGLDLSTHPAYPAAYVEPNLISVAAVDRAGRLLGSSNRGPTVTAKGQGVGVATCTLDAQPATTGATSAASALIAGAAAQHLLDRPDSIEELKAALESAPAFASAAPCHQRPKF